MGGAGSRPEAVVVTGWWWRWRNRKTINGILHMGVPLHPQDYENLTGKKLPKAEPLEITVMDMVADIQARTPQSVRGTFVRDDMDKHHEVQPAGGSSRGPAQDA